MALVNIAKNRRTGSTWERLCGSLFPTARRSSDRKRRRLVIDQLEERTLLSVSAVDVQDKLVNQAISSLQSTTAAKSLAMDDDGDFVVVWSRIDPVLDADGNEVIDPKTDQPMTDANIYARYFTNEVQRIVLPEGILDDSNPNSLAKLSITCGGNEVQELTFSVTTPSGTQAAPGLIAGTFQLSFGGDTTVVINFDEAEFNSGDPTTDPALLIQAALRDLGGTLSDVVVKGMDPHSYKISFGEASQGQDQEQIQIQNMNFTSGWLPSALTKTVSEPVTIVNIPIFPNDPTLTALAIEDAFQQVYQSFLSPPSTSNQIPANNGPVFVRVATPTVAVTPVKTAEDPLGLRTFNIEFVGDSGYINQPTVVIAPDGVVDENGESLNAEPILGVTIKESSDEFRVNPEEPDNPATMLPDKFNQTNPDVAMDSDGSFVIVWQSEVPNGENPGSFSDIFARRYEPVSYVDPGDAYLGLDIMRTDMNRDGVVDDNDPQVQAVRVQESPVPYSATQTYPYSVPGDKYTFRVNALTTNPQANPSVAMDAVGNFVVSWSNSAQPISFFNSVYLRRFTHDGTPAEAVERRVNAEDTNVHDGSYMAMSREGHYLVLWSLGSNIMMKLYDANDGVMIGQSLMQRNASQPAAAFDMNNNFVVNWTENADYDAFGAVMSIGVYAREYALSGAQIRPDFRINSPTVSVPALTTWSLFQLGGQVVMDADGDITGIYEGYGPDASTSATAGRATALLRELINQPEHADLIALWPDLETISLPLDGMHSGDTDGVLEEVLFNAQNLYDFNDEQLGRLRAIMETVLDLLRGEAYGIMYSQFDAEPTFTQSLNVVADDSVSNTMRDGWNSRWFMTLPANAMDGTFFLGVVNLMDGSNTFADIEEVEPAWMPNGDDKIIDPDGTTDVIQGWLDSSPITYGNCIVRRILPDEFLLRQGTYWELDYNSASQYIYEVTFVGNMHDIPTQLIAANIDLTTKVGDDEFPATPPPSSDPFILGDLGTYQHDASIGITLDGDYVIAWTQDDLDSIGSQVTSNLYFRSFDEEQDTAGPTVTRVFTGDNTIIDQNAKIYDADGMNHFVVSFGEDMLADSSPDSVLNPANYALLLDGAKINGAIVKVEYGLNRASELARWAIEHPDEYGEYAELSLLPTNHYEAILTIDGNGTGAGSPTLGMGAYTLQLITPKPPTDFDPIGHSGLRDAANNVLQRTGFAPEGEDFFIDFTLTTAGMGGTPTTGVEIQVNETTVGAQTTGKAIGTGSAQEFAQRSVAVDHDGDFAAVWVSYGQDGDSNPLLPNGQANPNFDPNAASNAGVYVRLFDRNNNPLTGEILVNTFTVGNQIDPCIAMDADGDFVVVWAGEGQDLDGSWGIYGQKFDSMGRKLGGEFQINSNAVNDQVAPAIAMNSAGNFVVVWASKGQSYSFFNNIQGQLFNSDGQRVGSEFRVNSADIPGVNANPTSNELHPVVAMSEVGTFAVVWDAVTTQKNGVRGNSIVMARLFDANGNPITIPEYDEHAEGNTEFQVDVGDDTFTADYEHLVKLEDNNGPYENPKRHTSRNAQVAMSWTGTFIITWEEYRDNDQIDAPVDVVNSWGVYYRRFAANGVPDSATDSQANLTITALVPPPMPTYSMQQSAPYAGAQVNPSISMDADGDYVIVWDGNGATADPSNPTVISLMTDRDPQGIFTRTFHAQDYQQVHEAVSQQSRVNLTQQGYQRFSSVGMTPSGDYVVVWSGKGTGDVDGVFARRYDEPTDTAGPMLTDFLLPDGTSIQTSRQVTQPVYAVVLSFDEELLAATATDPANYQLLRDGVNVSGGVTQVFFGLDMAYQLSGQYGLSAQQTNKWQAVLIVDANGASPGTAPLTDGQYQIVALNSIRDKAGNPLLGFAQNLNGSIMSQVINVTLPTGQESKVASGQTPTGASYGKYTTANTADTVAADADGDYVVVWTDTTPGHRGVWAKMYTQTSTQNTDGTRTTAVAEFAPINPDTGLPWANNEILISADTTASDASVARDADGDFVVTWSQWSSGGSWDVYAQVFDNSGQPLTEAFMANSTTTDVQHYSSVAMDADGDFIVVWQSNAQDGSGYGIFAQRFTIDGFGGGELQVNDTATGDQIYADVAMDAAGNCVVTWTSYGQHGDGAIQTNVYAKRLFEDDDSTISEAEFLVNAVDPISQDGEGNLTVVNNIAGNQSRSSVAMDADGDFVIVWTSYGQDGVGNGYGPGANGLNGVYAKRFTAAFDPAVSMNGNLYITNPDQASNVFRVNQTAQKNQQNARVSMDSDGDFTVAWESDQDGNWDVYIRRYAKTSEVQYGNSQDNLILVGRNPFLGSNGEIGGELRINTTVNGNQRFPGVAMDDAGDAVIVWSGRGEVAGQEDAQGIFMQRFARPADDAGPTISDAALRTETSSSNQKLVDGMVLDTKVSTIILTFSEDLLDDADDPSSVLNLDNWQLLRGNSNFSTEVVEVLYGLNQASLSGLTDTPSNKFEAVIYVDGNSYADGDQPLGNGAYTLTLSDAVQDNFGNALDGNFDGTPGGAYTVSFRVDLSGGSSDPGLTGDSVAQYTNSARSVAMDDDGDFVIVYTREDAMLDTDGTPLIDPVSGEAMYGSNIYARYYTKGVQRITLPAGVLADAVANKNAKFSITFGDNEVQKISFSQATPSLGGSGLSAPIGGTFSLWFDIDGDGIQDPGEVTETIDFFESAFNTGDPDFDPAIAMQNALRSLGGALSDVVVDAADSDEYLIKFGNASGMQVQPRLMVIDQIWETGFLPSAEVSIVSEPIALGVTTAGAANIPVSASNGALTAAAIEQAFLATTYTSLIAPDSGADVDPANGGPFTRTSAVKVLVTPVKTASDPDGLRTFDIMFVEDLAYEILPELVIPAGQVVGETGAVLNAADISAVIKKQSSIEFRVNPEVPINEFQLQPDECYNPSVAMDADGSFVIAWTATVSDLATPGSVSDIFARRFEPAGTVAANDPGLWVVDLDNDSIPETAVQGVRPVEADVPYNDLLPSDLRVPGDLYTFRVNTDTTNAQDQSSVAMDHYGNFVVTWAGYGQEISFFNVVYAQQFSHDTTAVNNEVIVSLNQDGLPDTDLHYDPYVALSDDGHWLVVWTHNTTATGHDVYTRLFDPEGETLIPMANVRHTGRGEPEPTAAFDSSNNFIICWTEQRDQDWIPSHPGPESFGVYFREFALDGTPRRDTDQRANSALRPGEDGVAQMIGLNPDAYMAIWSGDQYGGQIVMDADGDIIISYEGFGPAVAETASSGLNGTDLLIELINRPENADLVAAWPALASLSLPYGRNNTGDADSVIEEVLIQAQKYQGFSDEQLGRLNGIMNAVLAFNRGEADGVMYARYDADPILGPQNVLASDNVVNEDRDGTNTRYVITLDKDITTGSFVLRITNGQNREDIEIAPVFTDDDPARINTNATRQAIEDTLQLAVQELGINWPTRENGGGNNGWLGPVTVRLMSDQEITDREGTHWDLTDYGVSTDQYVYEIQFLGEVHNTTITLGPPPGNARWNELEVAVGDDTAPAPAPLFVEITGADSGTSQHSSSMAVTPNGDYVVVWTQNNLDSSGLMTGQEIQYRLYNETVDTAGPRVGNWFTAGGTIIEDGGTVYDVAGLTHVVISFTEAMYDNAAHTGDAVTNPANYVLSLDGAKINGAIVSVEYGMNKAADLAQLSGYSDLNPLPTNRWEVVLTIDANGTQAGTPPLAAGDYELEALAPKTATTDDPTSHSGLRDRAGNALGRTGITPLGVSASVTFSIVGGGGGTDPGDPGGTSDPVVNTTRPGDQSDPVVATDAEGNYVVVWVTYDEDGAADIMAQMFNSSSKPVGKEFAINSFTTGNQLDPAVAMDDEGNFIVTWSGQGQSDQAGVYGRLFDNTGTAVSDDFRINQTIINVQDEPSVAMDPDGDFVVTWTSYGQDGDMDGIYARRFSAQGTAKNGEILANSTVAYRQDKSDVAMDNAGNFVVVWQSDQQDGNSWGIYGQRFSAAGAKLGSEFQANTHTFDKQIDPVVAMDADGDFVVAWSSFGQDGNGYGVYARRYSPVGVARTANEFRVNQTTPNWQVTPDVSMSGDGRFAVVWAAFGQDNVTVENPTYDYGIYGRLFNADGSDYKSPTNGSALGEFRLNAYTRGNQFDPTVAYSDGGNIAAAWTGPDKTDDPVATPPVNTDIFSRVISTSTNSASGPAISQVGVSQALGFMSWNVADPDGVAGSSITIDGVKYSAKGPWAAASGMNYTLPISSLAAGTHNYVVTAVDKVGNTSTLTGSFVLTGGSSSGTGPAISQVAVSQALGFMSWNAVDSNGVASSSITIDGVKYSAKGPWQAASGVNFTLPVSSLAAGTHNYVITAVDKAGNSSTLSGSFPLTGASATDTTKPTISQVVVSQTAGFMSWNVLDAGGVASSSITINGTKFAANGPYASSSGVNFSRSIAKLPAGTYNYVITAVDKAGLSSQKTGSFELSGSSVVARNSIFGDLGSSDDSDSPKVDWLFDL